MCKHCARTVEGAVDVPLQHSAADHLRVGGGGLGAVAVRPAQAAQHMAAVKVDIDANSLHLEGMKDTELCASCASIRGSGWWLRTCR